MPDSTVAVTRDISASPESLWNMVSDVARMPEWSPENVAVRWLGGASGPATGARFQGTNQHGGRSWKSVATITEAVPGREFAFRVKAAGLNVADWRYSFEPTGTGCRVTETWVDRRGFLVRTLSSRVTGVADRAAHNRAGMEVTLARLDKAASAS